MTQESLLPPERAVPDPVVCPYLGLADDPRTHFSFATVGHRCHSPRGPKQIELTHQGSFCLSLDYPACRRFVDPPQEPVRGLPVGPSAAVGVVAPLRIVPGPVMGTKPASGASGATGATGRRRPGARRALILAAVLAIAIAAGWPMIQGGAVPAVEPGASGASPAPSLNPTPSAVGSPRATGTPGAGQTDARTTPTTHIVLRNETLSSIARRYGVTVDDILAANGLTDPNYITIGQKLIIPAP